MTKGNSSPTFFMLVRNLNGCHCWSRLVSSIVILGQRVCFCLAFSKAIDIGSSHNIQINAI